MSRAVLFPGQGAQKVGMGADFAERFPAARALFDRADAVLGSPLTRQCFEGPADELTLTRNCQPAIFVTSAAIVTALEEAGALNRDDVSCTAGLSLGEYTALWYAGALTFEDGLRLVARRGAAMQEASDDPPSGMVSLIGADIEKATDIANLARGTGTLVVANILSPQQVVLSGSMDACERVPAVAKKQGVKRAIPLNVAGAFHSPLMDPAAEQLIQILDDVEIATPRCPVISNVTGEPTTDPATIRRNLGQQVVESVQWSRSMQALVAMGLDGCVEPGPGRVLSGLMRKIDRTVPVQGYDCLADLEGAAAGE